MTTNQTIDGVPRELLRWLDDFLNDGLDLTVEEASVSAQLRALLDAKPVMCHGCMADGVSPDHFDSAGKCKAAQPQGEPVALLSKGFTTLETGDGKYRIITQYKNRDDAWSDYTALCKAAHLGILKHCKPAAQPQGEPVAWMDPRSPEMHATISNEVKQHNLKFGGAPSAAVNGYSIPLYAEQPAPVAVVLPERREPTQDNPYLSDADHEWNAFRDELKRLNPSL